MSYSFGWATVHIPREAEIWDKGRFGVNGRMNDLVQEVLHELYEEHRDDSLSWDHNKPVIFTLEGLPRLPRLVVKHKGQDVQWGVCRYHTAKRPQSSPFVYRRKLPTVDKLTVELVGSADRPVLTRVYPGDYTPPLPWQAGARHAEGGLAKCHEFWRSHSIVAQPGRTLKGGLKRYPPQWARGRFEEVANVAG